MVPSLARVWLLFLALPVAATACPSLEDPTPPFELALFQGVAVLVWFGVVQDLLRRWRLGAHRPARFDPWIHVHLLFLGLHAALVATVLFSDGLGASGYGPATDFGLAFTAATALAIWGTVLMGLPVGLFRAGCCRMAGSLGRDSGRGPTFVLRLVKPSP
jgi:hypothetical protein